MTRKNAIALVALGMVIGSLVTALLFSFLAQDPEGKEDRSERALNEERQAEPEGHRPPPPGEFTRDIKGDCAFSGTVQDRRGNPIRNALVRLRLLDQPWSSPDPPVEMRTDADGQFHLTGLSEKLGFQLWVWAPGYSASSQDHLPCGSHTRLALDRGAALKLRLTNAQGTAVGPARIQLMGSDLWPARLGYSNADGALTIHGLEVGEYIVWADTNKLSYVSTDPIPLEAGQEETATLVLTAAKSARVVVTDKSTGNPVPEATVLIAPSSTYLMHKVAVTDENGAAVISTLGQGDYSATVIADGFQISTPVPCRFDTDTAIALEKGVSVTGTVRTMDGVPIPGAILDIQERSGRTPVTLLPGRSQQLRRRILDAAGSGWPRLYETEAGRYVPGPRNIPVPSNTKTNRAAGDANSRTSRTTDRDGNFHLDGLPSGKIALRARHADFVMADRVVLTLQQGKNLTDMQVVMQKGTTVSVRVLDERGYPVRGAEVTVYNDYQEAIATSISRADGTANVGGLPGIFRIEAVAPGLVPAGTKMKVRTGTEHAVSLTLPAADKTLRGRVLDQQGFGIPSASVTARAISKGLLHAVSCETESDGTFVIEGIGAGGYHVIADAGNQGRAQVPEAYFDTEVKLVVATNRRNQPPTVFPIEQPNRPSAKMDVGDATGATDFPAIRLNEEASSDTVSTPFGDAENLSVTGSPSGKGGLPISIGSRGGKVIVTHIRSGSQVAMAGLSKGDRIVAINNRKVPSPAAARRALQGPIGSVVTMTIENRGEQFTVIVQRVRIK